MSYKEAPFERLRPGVRMAASEYNRLCRAVERLSGLEQVGLQSDGSGLRFLPNLPESFWGRVTEATNDTYPRHSWVLEVPHQNGGYHLATEVPSGTSQEFPAYEANFRKVRVGTRARFWQTGSAFLVFQADDEDTEDYYGEDGYYSATLVTDVCTVFGNQGSGSGSSTAAFISSRVGRATSLTITQATRTTIPFTFERWDEGNLWNVGQPTRLTASVSGFYFVGGFIGIERDDELQWEATATLYILKNGELWSTQQIGPTNVVTDPDPATNFSAVGLNVNTLIQLAAGDYVELAVLWNFDGTPSYSVLIPENRADFWMFRCDAPNLVTSVKVQKQVFRFRGAPIGQPYCVTNETGCCSDNNYDLDPPGSGACGDVSYPNDLQLCATFEGNAEDADGPCPDFIGPQLVNPRPVPLTSVEYQDGIVVAWHFEYQDGPDLIQISLFCPDPLNLALLNYSANGNPPFLVSGSVSCFDYDEVYEVVGGVGGTYQGGMSIQSFTASPFELIVNVGLEYLPSPLTLRFSDGSLAADCEPADGGEVAGCCSGTFPSKWTMTLSGFSSGSCDCSSMTGPFELYQKGSCVWQSPGSCTYTLVVTASPGEAPTTSEYTLTIECEGCATSVVYSATLTNACCTGTKVLNLEDAGGCAAPLTITLTPTCA